VRPRGGRLLGVFGFVVLVGLSPSACDNQREAPATLSREAAIQLCIELEDRMFACKDNLAERYARRDPRSKEQALAQITRARETLPEVRRAKCNLELERMHAVRADYVDRLRACGAEGECNKFLDCILPLARRTFRNRD
jgi:hypothetical protein